MSQLYLGGYIKKDKIARVLHLAKDAGKLPGIDDRMQREFMQNFEAITGKRQAQYQSKIDQREMQDIINRIRLNHNDHLDDESLDIIASILLDTSYEFPE